MNKKIKKKTLKNTSKKTIKKSNELELLKKEKKRLLAEIVNKQEQWNKEKINVSMYCTQNLIHDLIDILNSFELSLKFKVKEEETKNFLKGVKMTQNLLEKKLEEYNLIKIPVNIGDLFDEKYHEVLETKWEKDSKENTILKIKQSGYKLHDRILQTVKIVLNKKNKKEREDK